MEFFPDAYFISLLLLQLETKALAFRFYTRKTLEKIKNMFRPGTEPGTSGLGVRRATAAPWSRWPAGTEMAARSLRPSPFSESEFGALTVTLSKCPRTKSHMTRAPAFEKRTKRRKREAKANNDRK